MTTLFGGNNSNTLVVDNTTIGTQNCEGFGSSYSTIHDAVNAAQNGDTIKVCKGDYNEQATVRVDNLTIMNGADVSTPSDVNWYYKDDVLKIGDSNNKPKNLTVENISLHSTSTSSNSKAIRINYATKKITLQNLLSQS